MRDVPSSGAVIVSLRVAPAGVLCEELCPPSATKGSWGRSGVVRSLVKSWVNPDMLAAVVQTKVPQHDYPAGEVLDPLPVTSPAMSLVCSGKRCRRREPSTENVCVVF